MTGLELLKAPGTTAGEIADIISKSCPPEIPVDCDDIFCRDCWLAWLTGSGLPEKTEPPTEQATPLCGGCPLQGRKRELIKLGRFLEEVESYVKPPSPDRTSQSQ